MRDYARIREVYLVVCAYQLIVDVTHLVSLFVSIATEIADEDEEETK